jgi:hypothetical protein
MKNTLFYRYWTASTGRVLFLAAMLTMSTWCFILTPTNYFAGLFSLLYIALIAAFSSNMNPAWRATREKMKDKKCVTCHRYKPTVIDEHCDDCL